MVNAIRLGGNPIRLERRKEPLPFIPKFLKSTKTTAVLAGTLGTLVSGPILGAKAFLGTGLVGGALEASPILRKQAKEKIIDPTRTGRFIGKTVENPSRLFPKDKTQLEKKIKDSFKAAGVIGGTTAAVLGGTALLKKGIEKAKSKKVKFPKINPNLLAGPSKLEPLVPKQIPLGPAKRVTEQAEDKIKPKSIPAIKNTFKPEINISFRNSKKFINQQVLVK